jgi:hypothetical protein
MIGDFVDISLERVDAVNRSHEPPAEGEQRLPADIGGQLSEGTWGCRRGSGLLIRDLR